MTSFSRELEMVLKTNVESHKSVLEHIEILKEIAKSIENQNPSSETNEYHNDRKTLEKLEKNAKELINIAEYFKVNTEILKKAVNPSNSTSVEPLKAEGYEEAMKEAKKKITLKTQEDWYKNNQYREFVGAYWDVHNQNKRKPWAGGEGEDADIEVLQESDLSSITCPLSRRIIEHPIRIKLCGHICEKAAVLQYLGNRQKDCPITGCSVKFTKNDLEEDVELEVRVQKTRVRETQRLNQASQRQINKLPDEEDETTLL